MNVPVGTRVFSVPDFLTIQDDRRLRVAVEVTKLYRSFRDAAVKIINNGGLSGDFRNAHPDQVISRLIRTAHLAANPEARRDEFEAHIVSHLRRAGVSKREAVLAADNFAGSARW